MARPLKTCLALLGAATMAACAQSSVSMSSAVTWEKPGVDAEGMRREFGLCGGNFNSLGLPSFHPSEFAALDACMQGKGFTRKDL